MKEYLYTVIIEPEKEGGYHAFCPALPGCHTQGNDYPETIENIKDAIKLFIKSLQTRNEEIPIEDLTIKPLRIAV